MQHAWVRPQEAHDQPRNINRVAIGLNENLLTKICTKTNFSFCIDRIVKLK